MSWVAISRTKLRMGFVKDAALARKYALAHPEHMEFALRVAALREFASAALRRPRVKAQRRTPEEDFRARSWCWYRLCWCRDWAHYPPHPWPEGAK